MYSLRGPIDPDDGELASAGRRFYRRGVYADAAREAGEKIGLLRRSHGVTLGELAREAGIGVRLLAEIERGERAPDLNFLIRVARRFRRPIEYFFATTLESQPYYYVERAHRIQEISAQQRRNSVEKHGTGRANLYRPLASGFPERGLHPYYVQLVAVPPETVTPHEHHGQEFIYVLDGEVELITSPESEQVELLRPGDSVFLDSRVPHLLRGHSRNPYASTSAEVLDVFWSPLGADYLFSH